MSWDIFVQDLPAAARTIEDVPDDFEPAPLGARAELIEKIRALVPDVDFSDPSWGVVEGPDYSIEINLGSSEEIDSFAFHVRGGDMAAGIVADILAALHLRAIDPNTESGFFETGQAVSSLRKWRQYRDQVVEDGKHEPARTTKYHLKAQLLCHDVRLNTWVETMVTLSEAPSPEQAERLLWPAAAALVAEHDCEDCPYELSDVCIVPAADES